MENITRGSLAIGDVVVALETKAPITRGQDTADLPRHHCQVVQASQLTKDRVVVQFQSGVKQVFGWNSVSETYRHTDPYFVMELIPA